jgi:hypothetical protein
MGQVDNARPSRQNRFQTLFQPEFLGMSLAKRAAVLFRAVAPT